MLCSQQTPILIQSLIGVQELREKVSECVKLKLVQISGLTNLM